MAEHYYTANPEIAHDEKGVIFEVLGLKLSCTTDSGVFSRDGLDMGTRIMLEALPELSGRILDLGCGWGPVGTALGKKYPDAEIIPLGKRACERYGQEVKSSEKYPAHSALFTI